MNKKSVIPGVIIITISLILFVVAVSRTIPFPPTSIIQYIVLIFTLLGINFGISSGKKLAYSLHDKRIMVEQTQEHDGRAITAIPGSFMRNSIIFTFLTIILWSLFIIILSFFWTILNDRVILGEVRWLMIFSMILLICGSYIFYRAKSYNIPDMLTFTGKRMKQGNDIMKKAVNITEKTEQTGTNMVKKLWKK